MIRNRRGFTQGYKRGHQNRKVWGRTVRNVHVSPWNMFEPI